MGVMLACFQDAGIIPDATEYFGRDVTWARCVLNGLRFVGYVVTSLVVSLRGVKFGSINSLIGGFGKFEGGVNTSEYVSDAKIGLFLIAIVSM